MWRRTDRRTDGQNRRYSNSTRALQTCWDMKWALGCSGGSRILWEEKSLPSFPIPHFSSFFPLYPGYPIFLYPFLNPVLLLFPPFLSLPSFFAFPSLSATKRPPKIQLGFVERCKFSQRGTGRCLSRNIISTIHWVQETCPVSSWSAEGGATVHPGPQYAELLFRPL